MARLIVKPAKLLKDKQEQPANNTNKRAKKWAAFDFYHVFGWIWETSKFDILSRVACDCTWLPANRLQNFYFSTLSSLSHKASVFLLDLPLSQKVFYRQLSLLQTVTSFSPLSPVIGLGDFLINNIVFETHQLPYGAKMFSFVSQYSSSIQTH